MKVNQYVVSKQVETFCPGCNSFYTDFLQNVNVNNEKGGNKFYHATCYECLDAMRNIEIYLSWQSRVFVNKTLSFNLSPIYKLYN